MDWRDIPSLSALRAFEAAARLRNLSAAARELNVTHAAIAQHVRALEAEFSTDLLVRQGRGVAPTAAGQELANDLRDGFAQIGSGVRNLRNRTEDRPLMVTATPTFATNWLMPRMADFWATHPDLQVSISPSSTLIDLKRDGFDLAIRYGKGDWPGLVAEKLTEGEFWIAAHPDLIAGRKVDCIEDVLDWPWLKETHLSERLQLLELLKVSPSELCFTTLQTNNLVMSAALAGMGVILQPRALIEREVADGRLQKICTVFDHDLGYFLVWRPGTDTGKLRKLINWLRQEADRSQSEFAD